MFQLPTKETYIGEVINLFKTEFFEKNNEENIKYSKTNSNVRLHYFDIRDHLDIFFLTKIINQKIIKYIDLLNKDEINKKKYIEKILLYIEKISEKINLLYKNTEEVINNIKVYDKQQDKQKYYLNKMINLYSDNILKKNINLFFEQTFQKSTK